MPHEFKLIAIIPNMVLETLNLYAYDDFDKAFVGSSEWIASAIEIPQASG